MNAFALLAAIIATLGFVVFLIGDYYVSYDYERKIGSHIENAYEVNTPDRMIVEIQKAKDGMLSEGLKSEDYGAWNFKKPDNSMEFQYQFLDSVIERAKSVELWYNNTYSGKQATTESLGDVYEQKMDNLREFLKENGRADWIAKNAWYVKNHLVYYFIDEIFIIGSIFLLILW